MKIANEIQFEFPGEVITGVSLAYYLSLEIIYLPQPDGSCIEQRDVTALPGMTPDLESEIWALADGLTEKYHFKRQTGQCSLQNVISQLPKVTQ